jgi:aminopeptidase YwaD
VIRRSITLLAVLTLLASVVIARPALVPPSAAELKGTADALTAPGMDGRRSGTPGGDRAARQLADWLKAAGLRPGGEGESFFQPFVVASGAKIAAGTTLRSLTAGAPTFEAGRDWTPHGGSLRESVTGEIVFVGYGVSAPGAGYDDWAAVDARGRIAVALDGAPPHLAGVRPTRLEKLIAARRAGASALLIVVDRLPALAATATVVRIVSGALTVATADALLAPSGTTTARVAQTIAERRAPAPLAGVRAEVRVALDAEDRTAVNVIGVLPGSDPARAGEAIVVGAHYDHLGVVGGALYPGADDNASGSAVVVGLARAFAAAGPFERTLVFALFGAEEIGLVGSGHYVRRPTVPIDHTTAMLNFDMVGRLGSAKLTVGGVDSGRGLRDVVADAARAVSVGVTLRDSPFGPSDHSRFYDAGAPVLFFHTGSHADYHRPGDTADKLDAAGMARAAALGARVAERLAEGDRPVYVALARPPASPRAGREAGAAAPVFFGVGTDGRAESDGLRLTRIVPDSAAARAGLREGDVLVRFGDRGVDAFEDLTGALRRYRRGDEVRVLYLRDGLEHDTTATLDARP